MTFSEFGRRIRSNASIGTDHGAAAPMFLFGKKVVSGMHGQNPALPFSAGVDANIPFQYDFRSVYASVLQQLFCVPQQQLDQVLFKNFQTLNLIHNAGCTNAVSTPLNSPETLVLNYPNPFTLSTTINFKTNGGHTLVQVIDGTGKVIKVLMEKDYPNGGSHNVTFDSEGLATGIYYVRLQNGPLQQVRPMLKVR
jgi:hypothetical protein